jgi:hypothetical protein
MMSLWKGLIDLVGIADELEGAGLEVRCHLRIYFIQKTLTK